jgi:hypothetical protein
MQIDVAVQSVMKPESLLYTPVTLKEQSGDLIDSVAEELEKGEHAVRISVFSRSCQIRQGPTIFRSRPRLLHP